MTEQFSSSTEQRGGAPRIENAPDGLQIDRIDEVVGMGQQIDADYRNEHKKASARDLAVNRHHAINSMLAERGISFGETEVEQADYKLAYTIYETAIAHDQNTWLFLTEEDNTRTPRDVVFSTVFTHFEDRTTETPAPIAEEVAPASATKEVVSTPETSPSAGDTDETPAEQPQPAPGSSDPTARKMLSQEDLKKIENGTNVDIDEFKAMASEQIDGYAEKVAKRSRSIIEGAKTGKGIEAAGNELSDLLSGIASEMYAELEASGMDHREIVAKIDAFIEEQTEATLAKVEAHRLKEYNESRPYMQKVYDTWANWSDDGKKGLKGGRVKKAAVFAAGGAAAGLLLGPLVGAVGVGVVTGAAAVAGSRSIGRHLANGFMKKRDKKFAQAQTDEMRGDLQAIYAENDQANDARKQQESPNDTQSDKEARNIDLIEFVNERSREYRNRNRKRVLAGTAIAMTVGLFSSTLAESLENVEWRGAGRLPNVDWKNPFAGVLGNPFREPGMDLDFPWFDGPDNGPDLDGDSIPNGSDSDRDGDGTLNRYDTSPNGVAAPELDRDGDGVRNWVDSEPDNPDVSEKPVGPEAPKPTPDTLDISEAARYVVPNEGGFQTLQELGVPEYKWEAIWEDAGSVLHDSDKTYRMDDGRWGWSDDMRLSDRDIEILTNAAARNGVTL